MFEPEVCIVDAVIKDDVKCTTFKDCTVNLSLVESYVIPASVASCPPVVVNTTLLASKDDVIDVMLASFVVTLVLNEDETALNDPDIPAAVNTGFASNVVVLVLNEELAALNEPDIPAAVKGEANAPEISDYI